MHYDIFFLSHLEANAEASFEKLSQHCNPTHVSGITGIYRAHRECALLSTTPRFFVVDADSVLIPQQNGEYFNFNIDFELSKSCVYVWNAKNPVNGLEYGYGGIKLFSRDHFESADCEYVDMTSTVAHIKTVSETISETRFNISPFDAWKAGFRESCKLMNGIKKGKKVPAHINRVREERLHTWMFTNNNAEYGEYCIAGSHAGAEYAKTYDTVYAINNFSWLKSYFDFKFRDVEES